MDRNKNKPEHIEYVTGSSLEKKRYKHFKWVSSGATLLIIGGILAGFVFGGSAIIEYSNEFLAGEDVAEEVAAVEEQGFTFAFGTSPSDDTDFSKYTIPEPTAELTQNFFNALETSPAFKDITSVEEIIPYDQIDKNGTISQSAMEEIISIAEGVQ